MKIQTARFGEIEVCDDEIFTFPHGLIGLKRWMLFGDEIGAPFKWLQSVEHPGAALVLLHASALSSFEVEMKRVFVEPFAAVGGPALDCYVIHTLAPTLEGCTVNLKGPILLDPEKKLAAQVMFPDPQYPARHLLFGEDSLEEGLDDQWRTGKAEVMHQNSIALGSTRPNGLMDLPCDPKNGDVGDTVAS